MAVILFAWIQCGLYPIELVGRIRKLLALQADAHVLRIGSMLVLDIQFVADTLEVTAVHLNTRLVGEHLHENTGLGAVKAGTYLLVVALSFRKGVQTPVVVVTTGILDLVELRLDAVAEGMRRTEVHRGTLH